MGTEPAELLESTAQALRDLGYDTYTNQSQSTSSCYVYAGELNENGGFRTIVGIRLATHASNRRNAGYQRDLGSWHIRTDRTKAQVAYQVNRALASLPRRDRIGVEWTPSQTFPEDL